VLPLNGAMTASFGLMLALTAHAVGWPVARGGSQKIADALASYLRTLGGRIVTSSEVRSLDDVPKAGAVLFDVTPRQILRIIGE
jgi:phytoene dehydrogenase-like protein